MAGIRSVDVEGARLSLLNELELKAQGAAKKLECSPEEVLLDVAMNILSRTIALGYVSVDDVMKNLAHGVRFYQKMRRDGSGAGPN